MTTPDFAAVVLCAGKGTRMKSDRAKVLHAILGRPLAWYPVTAAFEAGAQQVVAVVGHQGEAVKAESKFRVEKNSVYLSREQF